MPTKCLKINDSISNPTNSAAGTTGICVKVVSPTCQDELNQDTGLPTGDYLLPVGIKYFYSEAALDANKETLEWDNLPSSAELNATEAEWDTIAANELYLTKLETWLEANGFVDVVLVAK